jgi:hypothetical protein
MGAAWARHAMCESAFTLHRPDVTPGFTLKKHSANRLYLYLYASYDDHTKSADCSAHNLRTEFKAAFNKKRALFTSTLDLELRKKLVKCCYSWSIALYGAETWTLRAADQKHLESSEIWC